MNLLLLLGLLIFNNPIEVSEVRVMYAEAVTDSDAAHQLLQTLNEDNCHSPLLLAYRASAQALIAKHALNPYQKLNMLKVSAATFKKAVEQDPESVEIRFLRFSVQHYIPSWLGFSGDLNNDKEVIIQNLPRQMDLLKKNYTETIVRFLVETERCSREELHSLNTLKY